MACQYIWEQDYASKITQTPTVDGGDAKVSLFPCFSHVQEKAMFRI